MPTPTPTPANPAPVPTPVATAAATAAQHAFRGLADWVDVFRTGTHTDAKGQRATFTAADLDQMVANVGGSGVPAVLGHPQTEDRAWAWARPEDVRREGEVLQARFSDVDPEFAASVDSGAYRERSVSIVNDPESGWTLRHIGWLGATPPALKLRPLNYAAPAVPDGVEVLQFASGGDDLTAAWAVGDIGQLLRGLREWVISEKGLDVADRVLPDWRITSVADAAATMRQQAVAEDAPEGTTSAEPALAFASAAGGAATTTTTLTQADLDRAAEVARRQAETDMQARFAAQGAELSELRAARTRDRIGVQVNAWTAAGLVTPAEAPGLTEFMAALEHTQAAEFSFSAAAGGAPVSTTAAAWFAEFMAARRPVVQLGRRLAPEPAPGLDMNDAAAINRAAQNFMAAEAAAGRTVFIDQAVQHVTSQLGRTV